LAEPQFVAGPHIPGVLLPDGGSDEKLRSAFSLHEARIGQGSPTSALRRSILNGISHMEGQSQLKDSQNEKNQQRTHTHKLDDRRSTFLAGTRPQATENFHGRQPSKTDDAINRLIKDVAESGSGERPNGNHQPGRHDCDENPSGYVTAVVTKKFPTALEHFRPFSSLGGAPRCVRR
jgi:hypothetical protein